MRPLPLRNFADFSHRCCPQCKRRGPRVLLQLSIAALCFVAPLALVPRLSAQSPQTASSLAAPPTATLTAGERADIFLAERNYPAAISLLKDAIHRHHADASIYNRLGIAYLQTADFGGAQNQFKEAIKHAHENADYINNLGTAYYLRHKYKDATRQFEKAIKITPARATFYVNLGGAYFAWKKFPQAIAAYRTALRLDPNSLFPVDNGTSPVVQDITGSDTPRFHYDLARLFCSMGMLDDAVHQFLQAYDLHYADLKRSLTDPVFAPLRLRPEYRTVMHLPPLPPQPPKTGGGIEKTSGNGRL